MNIEDKLAYLAVARLDWSPYTGEDHYYWLKREAEKKEEPPPAKPQWMIDKVRKEKQAKLTRKLGQELMAEGATFDGLCEYFGVNERKLYNMGLRKSMTVPPDQVTLINRLMRDGESD